MLNKISAVIFDMDGVIFDSEKIYFDAFYVVADRYEIEVPEDFVYSFAGKTSHTCQLMLQQFFDNDFDKTQHFLQEWGKARAEILLSQGLPFKNGFLNLFDKLKTTENLPIGLVTSASYADMRENFEKSHLALLDHFTHIITLDDVRYPKPDPQPYHMMIRHLQLPADECVVIEDSETGASAALAAGAQTIMLNANSPAPDIDSRLLYRADHHDDILSFLQRNGL